VDPVADQLVEANLAAPSCLVAVLTQSDAVGPRAARPDLTSRHAAARIAPKEIPVDAPSTGAEPPSHGRATLRNMQDEPRQPVSPTPEEDADAIIARDPDIERWLARLRRGPWLPEAGSELAEDDREERLGDWPVSQLAWFSFGSGAEHLLAVRRQIANGETSPLASHTLLRSALLSASQAVWLLAPDDRPSRMARARELMLEIHEQRRKYIADLRQSVNRMGRAPDALLDKALAETDEHIGRIRSQRDIASETAIYQATRLIEQAGLRSFGSGFDIEQRLAWREGLCAVHGFVWSLMARKSTQLSAIPDNPALSAASPLMALHDLVDPYRLTYGNLRRAWRLLHARGGVTLDE
jgi:hypothetical protein